MSKSYNHLSNELKRANKKIKNLEFLAEVEAQEQKKINNTNLELLGRIGKLEKQLSMTKGQFNEAEQHCIKNEKKIRELTECLECKDKFIVDLQGQVNSLIDYSEMLENDNEESSSSVSELTEAIKTISKYLK